MTRKKEEPTSPTAAERITRRGLGNTPIPRDLIPRDQIPRNLTATGEFPLTWPQLSESPEMPPGEEIEDAEDDEDALDVRDPEEVTSSWQRPQSRGPEYHPPILPAAARDRPPTLSTSSGTFRVGSPPPPPALPSFPMEGEPRHNSSVPPVERSVGRSSALPARARFGGRHLGWPVVAGLTVGSVLALALVRVPVRAWGVLRAAGVPESLSAPLPGTVTKVRVSAGDRVNTGDVILELRSAELEWNLQTRRAELERLRSEADLARKEEQAVLARNLTTLARRHSLMEERLAIKDIELAQRKALLDELAARTTTGAAQPSELREPSASFQATSEDRLGIVDELSQLDLDVNDRRSAQQANERARRARLAEAEASVLHAQSALDGATVRAPAAGWVESLNVAVGSPVLPGVELARLVPGDTPRTVVALLASEDAAGVSAGEGASVELAGPYQATGTPLPASIRYVSREIAPAARVQALLGGVSLQGFVQLELELVDSPELQAVTPQLRSGSRALVRLPTPHRRLGSVLFNAAQQWWTFNLWS
jgi:multidrug resistance efflux pump